MLRITTTGSKVTDEEARRGVAAAEAVFEARGVDPRAAAAALAAHTAGEARDAARLLLAWEDARLLLAWEEAESAAWKAVTVDWADPDGCEIWLEWIDA